MLANIENINYTQEANEFYIITEFSVLPIEKFNNKGSAEEFIIGYKTGLKATTAMCMGELYRRCIEGDMELGVKYEKVREVVEMVK